MALDCLCPWNYWCGLIWGHVSDLGASGLIKRPFGSPGLSDRSRAIPASIHIPGILRPRARCLRVATLGALAQRGIFWNPADELAWARQRPRRCRCCRSGLHAVRTMSMRPPGGSLGPSPSAGSRSDNGSREVFETPLPKRRSWASGPRLRRLRCKSLWFPRTTALPTFSSPTRNCEQQ